MPPCVGHHLNHSATQFLTQCLCLLVGDVRQGRIFLTLVQLGPSFVWRGGQSHLLCPPCQKAGKPAQVVACRKRGKRQAMAFFGEGVHPRLAGFHPFQGHKGGFLLGRVRANGLAKLRLAAHHIQQIILNLEGQAQLPGIGSGSCPPPGCCWRQWRPDGLRPQSYNRFSRPQWW